MYEVAIHAHGRKVIRHGPLEGCLDFPRHQWTRITSRPVGLERAKVLADSQHCHAVVCVWGTAQKVYDNEKPAAVPEGWRSVDAITAFDK